MTFAKAHASGAFAQLLARKLHVALERGSKAHLFAARDMGQADLGLLPLHTFVFALVPTGGAALHCGHHGAVGLDNDGLFGCHWVG